MSGGEKKPVKLHPVFLDPMTFLDDISQTIISRLKGPDVTDPARVPLADLENVGAALTATMQCSGFFLLPDTGRQDYEDLPLCKCGGCAEATIRASRLYRELADEEGRCNVSIMAIGLVMMIIGRNTVGIRSEQAHSMMGARISDFLIEHNGSALIHALAADVAMKQKEQRKGKLDG